MSKSGWHKGNIHTHTTESDGDASPQHVSEWYRAHGYDFLVLSDHNHLTVLADAEKNRGKWPLLLPGEEVTCVLPDGGVPVHINGVGLQAYVEPYIGADVVDTLQQNVERIRAAGGLASINHPNYKWAFGDREISQVAGVWAMEVLNGHPGTNSFGGGGKPGAEAMWDRVLSAGRRIMGVATDDAHHYTGEFSPERANPGRGWIVVRAERCEPAALLAAMSEGDFYASTGVVINDLRNGPDEIVLEIAPRGDERLTTVFYGDNGREIWRAEGPVARLRVSRLDTYVRATVMSSKGDRAWTQPLFVKDSVRNASM